MIIEESPTPKFVGPTYEVTGDPLTETEIVPAEVAPVTLTKRMR
jgi:hypothetical protein